MENQNTSVAGVKNVGRRMNNHGVHYFNKGPMSGAEFFLQGIRAKFPVELSEMKEGETYRTKNKINGKYWYVKPYTLQYRTNNRKRK